MEKKVNFEKLKILSLTVSLISILLSVDEIIKLNLFQKRYTYDESWVINRQFQKYFKILLVKLSVSNIFKAILLEDIFEDVNNTHEKFR